MQKQITGFILINKSSGPSSHDVINSLRRISGIKKIGHAGTLDPLATGVLLVAIGRESTKKIDQFVKLDKEYIADVFLGATTDTFDKQGRITSFDSKKEKNKKEVEEVLYEFIGKQKQIPPMYSAKKVKGVTLYKLARKGVEIERKPADINIYDIELVDFSWPNLKIKISCSSGTYIRSLVYDIGNKLGCGAYLRGLQRTSIGKYNINQSVDLDKLRNQNWTHYLFRRENS